MSSVTQVFDWKPATGYELEIAIFAIAIEELATRFAIDLETWDEAGLGAARGAMVRLASGRIIVVQELRHLTEDLGWIRTDIIAETQDIATLGVDPLVEEVRIAFDLPSSMIEWKAGDETHRLAEKFLAAFRARKDGRTDEPKA